MIVISVVNCPIGLRGDLTKWLLEISPGVFVGQVSRRVREQLWQRITGTAKSSNVTMVFSTNNEQRLDFLIHNSIWEPIDFDGVKLMLRPTPARIRQQEKFQKGFSKAAKKRMARQFAQRKGKVLPDVYAVVDIETTGLNPQNDEIIEIGAILVKEHRIEAEFSQLVRSSKQVSPEIEKLTGITNEMIQNEGKELCLTMKQLFEFLGIVPVVSHNSNFDYGFLRNACEKCDLPLFSNRCIDTLSLARRRVKKIKNYKLGTLAEYFSIAIPESHRSIVDCEKTYRIFEELIKLDATSE